MAFGAPGTSALFPIQTSRANKVTALSQVFWKNPQLSQPMKHTEREMAKLDVPTHE